MNAINFLKDEHERVKAILADINDGSHRDSTKKNLFAGLCQDLIRHETMEHKLWYPHFKNKLSDTVKHLLTEEKSAEKAIKAFNNVKTQNEWDEKFSKFKKDVEHHAHEEEHELFPQVVKILDEEQLEAIGKEMRAFKKEYSVQL